MDSIQLIDHFTDHTCKKSNLHVEDNKVYQITYDCRNMSSKEQMDHVINSLIVDKGFIMDTERNKVITLINPTQPDVEYSIYTNIFSILKKSIKFIGEIDI
tara:strand:- start:2156 stop:2458 length:303 start_codon:yes stop_codon:yes gene_type:complete